MSSEIFKASMVIAFSILIAAFISRTKPEYQFISDDFVTVRINKTNGERCLMSDGVFRTWSVAEINDHLKSGYSLKMKPLIFCQGETVRAGVVLK
ncbi:hypothetical protein C5F52_28015 [Limnohabitans sp. TS-CS-82]|uniref:hypothetical protein n=1 Tax=Limnohabitans sp. TS-CS-82 TaxID=2094193 RepID=UPI000CF1F037|nr:hypothetical protein [Limnohabitans sp. TS-CS-82]PQA79885.1 hypothetical protein C5F52_28015 [Limnohabitans sp. TS-CS-82]